MLIYGWNLYFDLSAYLDHFVILTYCYCHANRCIDDSIMQMSVCCYVRAVLFDSVVGGHNWHVEGFVVRHSLGVTLLLPIQNDILLEDPPQSSVWGG